MRVHPRPSRPPCATCRSPPTSRPRPPPRPAPYPPLLCTAGLKDDRVPYWEPAKLIAQVRDQSTSQQPAVLLLDPDSGHQGSDDQHSEHAQAALLWAFARRCVGAGLEG